MHSIKRTLKQFLRGVLYCCPVNRNKIVFVNYDGKGYGDNPKYIAEEFLRQDLPVKLVWLVSGDYFVPDVIRRVNISGLKASFELSTAKVVISNSKSNIPSFFRKKKNQFYLQTWHGDFALKYIEKEVENELSASYVARSKADSAMTDAVVSGSSSFSKILRESFWLPEGCSILEFGVPRNDIYFKGDSYIDSLKQTLGFASEDRILLYAPTFRDKGETDCFDLDFEELRTTMCDVTGTEWKIVVRLHPNISSRVDLFCFNESIINGSVISDQQELCMISDCLVTDYSSIMGDFLLMRKPVFLYVPDLERYSSQVTGRGLRDLFYELPVSFCRTQGDLEELITEFDPVLYHKAVDCFIQTHYQSFDDGHASERIVHYLSQALHFKV